MDQLDMCMEQPLAIVPDQDFDTPGSLCFIDLESEEVSCERAKIPSSSVLPGPYSFRVELPHSEAKQVIKEENLLVINKGVYFAVFFHWDSPPPEDSVISALVLCADSNDFERFGPVVRCKNHLQEDGRHNFLMSKNESATYGHKGAHQVTDVPLDAMTAVKEGVRMCVYECTCYSTCVFGRGRTKSSLVITFTLTTRTGSVLGRDVINLKCCAGPVRAANKKRSQLASIDAESDAKRSRVSPNVSPSGPYLSPDFDREPDEEPDEDGYYTFTWRLKDPFVFKMLKLFKYSSTC